MTKINRHVEAADMVPHKNGDTKTVTHPKSHKTRRFWHWFFVAVGTSSLCLYFELGSVTNLMRMLMDDTSPRSSTATSTSWSEMNDTVNGRRLCRTVSFRLSSRNVVNRTSVVPTNNRTVPFNMQYSCSGKPYQDFSQKLIDFATDDKKNGHDKNISLWGRHTFPVPSNKSVLFLGNSHTRQVAHTLICQYRDVIDYHVQHGPDGRSIQLGNNATIALVTNSVLFYSTNWANMIADLIGGRPIQSFDAVILGKINYLDNSRKTKFMTLMQNLSATIDGVDFNTIPPPGLADLSKLYKGPIVTVGMFAQYAKGFDKLCLSTKKALETSGSRTNLRHLDGRKYVAMLGECGNDIMGKNATCLEPGDNLTHSRNPADMHRCVGVNGGHPDLIAWDIVDTLHELLTPPRPK